MKSRCTIHAGTGHAAHAPSLLLHILGLCCIALALPACRKNAPPPASAEQRFEFEDAQVMRQRKPAKGQLNPSTLLHAGRPPLMTIFNAGGQIRIVDADARATVLKTTIPPNSVIALDADSGIRIGRERVSTTPLHASHRYEIWWDAKP